MCRALLLGLFLLASCGSSVGIEGEYVGGACAADAECDADSRCLTKDDFPGGTCSVVCTKHEDCPDDTRCIEKEGGICLLTCELPGDCRGGYTCKGVKNQFGGGESLVCIK
jgi:hypothetical protein